jgi:microcystin-dependent protein
MEPFLGMVYVFGGNFAINGYAICQGQLLPISQNTALFSILGTTYGGNGTSNFALPNLQGRAVVGSGTSSFGSPFILGQTGGLESTTLLAANLPSHAHTLTVNSLAGTSSSPSPTGTMYLAAGAPTGSGPNASELKTYTTAHPDTNLGPLSIKAFGTAQPFPSLSPYLCMTCLIALQGVFPSRN